VAREVVEKLAADFLANPLIESWQIEEVEAVLA
jgi:phosphoribosylformylglycinamidine (FGAM) synthase PurS component